MSILQIPTARVFAPLFKPSRYKAAHGGRGSGKTHFFGEHLIRRCLAEPGLRSVCIREVQKSIKESSKRLIEDKIRKFNLSTYFDVQENQIKTPGDGLIIFTGMQNHTAESIKSLEGYKIAWPDEAQALSQRSLDILRPTMRGDAEIWFSWNPRSAKDPVDSLMRSGEPPPRSIVVEANWNDNPWFPQDLREEMEYDRRRDPDKYAWIWGGQYQRISEARVFRNWRIGELEIPAHCRPYYGADWGFSVDPTVLVRMWTWGRTLYIDKELYKIGLEIDRTPSFFDLMRDEQADPKKWPITADSAEPQTISYMQKHGYPRIEAAVKGPNSVEEGVRFLQSYDIVIHPECRHTADEFATYAWKQDKQTEEILPELEDDHNHVIDSCRYGVEKLRRAPPIRVSASLLERSRALRRA